jgi:hypothetical protein
MHSLGYESKGGGGGGIAKNTQKKNKKRKRNPSLLHIASVLPLCDISNRHGN